MIPVLPEQVLHAGALVLEPIVPAHAARLFDHLQAPELYTFIPHEAPASVQELATRYARWSARQSADGSEIWLNYAMYHPAGMEYVGTLQATLDNSGTAMIAYEVFPPRWRRGHARTACIALLAHVFASYDEIGEVSALLDTRNEASWRLLESIGFRRAGEIKAADWFKGASSDEYLYKITRREFAAAHPGRLGAP